MKKVATLFLLLTLLTTIAIGDTAVINAFNAGELSPLLEGRTDIKKYYSGCRTLENLVVLPHGGITKRPGSAYIASAKSGDVACRLIPFEFSVEQAYIIEMGNQYMRFYKDGGQITGIGGSAYEISTPYLTADLFEIQFVQSADIMYFAHSDYAPRSLTRTGHTSWTLPQINFERGPFLGEVATTTTITPSGVTGSITLTASASTFNANHVGALWQITHTVEAVEVSGSEFGLGDEGLSVGTSTVQLNRKYDFTTHGSWGGTILLQRSYDDSTTWKDVLSFNRAAVGGGNISYSDIEEVADANYRITLGASPYTTDVIYNLFIHSFDVDGVVTITGFTNSTTVTADVNYPLGDTTATKFWAEGAWSADEGYPSTIAFYEERQVYGATNNEAQTIWMSKTDKWDNFLAGTGDTDAISLTIAADQVNVIRWMNPQTTLLVGTTGGEWKVGATKIEEPISPTNISAKRQSNHGSAYIQANSMGNVVMYVQRQKQKIRKLEYSFELDNWIAPDLTLLSEHITGDGIVEMAYQKNPYPILWCVREDGTLIALTLEDSQEIVGWTRHDFDGDVESVAVIPGTQEDEVWISVKRTIDDSVVRYVEQIQPFDWGSDQEDCFFVDSGLTFDGGAATPVTGISQAFPGVVTAANHGFSDGDQVRIYDVNGMLEANHRVYTVGTPTTNTFELRDSLDEVNIDTRGTFAHWTMDDNAATTVVEDIYGHDGTSELNTEDLTVGGTVSSALANLQSANSRIFETDDSSDFTFSSGSSDLPFAITAWFKPTTNYHCQIIGKDSATELEYRLYVNAGTIIALLWDDSEAAFISKISDSVVISTETWYHVILNYSGSGTSAGITIYLDGTLIGTSADDSGGYVAMEDTDAGIVAGGGYGGTNSTIVSLDDVRMFNSRLATSTINALYNAGSGIGKPLGYSQYIDGGFVRQCENRFSTLTHLEGETVAVLQDGGDAGTKTVSSGIITLDDFYYVVHAGLPFTARLLPMKLELAGNPGALFGVTKRITEVTVRFYNTLGCDIGTSWTVFDSVVFHDVSDPLDFAPNLYTDDKTISFSGPYETAGNVYIQSSVPLPLTILAIMSKFEAYNTGE